MLNNIGKSCTACRACEVICPRKAITFVKDEYDVIYPYVNKSLCIDCEICNLVCHIQNPVSRNRIKASFASYSIDKDRCKSASGGIATSIYRLCLQKGYKAFGVKYIMGKGAIYVEVKDNHDIECVRNSKYVYSDVSGCYDSIINYLKNDMYIVFIGLPCQCASIKSHVLLKKAPLNKLLLIEIICHGVAPQEYLSQHIKYQEESSGCVAETLSFRDPEFSTNKYYFTLRNNINKIFYKCNDRKDDTYQLGYHNAIIYRENCFQCTYANDERVGDLVLCDWYYDGISPNIVFPNSNVSNIICCTKKGEEFIKTLKNDNKIRLFPRPIEEAIRVQTTLKHPHIKNNAREVFLEEYRKTHNFEKSMYRAYGRRICYNKFIEFFRLRELKRIVSDIIHKYNET